jgi:hypothetical protein
MKLKELKTNQVKDDPRLLKRERKLRAASSHFSFEQ